MNTINKISTMGQINWRPYFLVLVGAVLITIGAKVQIPFWPVPMTMHTFAIFLLAAGFGPKFGLAAMGVYLSAGAIGLPVFSGSPERGVGLAYMTGPTGGYLLGYFVAAGLIGWLVDHKGWLRLFVAMTLGLFIVYVFGLVWLSNFVPFNNLLSIGFTPFVIGDFVKIMLVATLLSAGKVVLRKMK